MKRIVRLSILSMVVLSVACVHQSPFKDEYYFQAMGDSSELVITADMAKLEDSSIVDLPEDGIGKTLVDRTDRVSVALNPKTVDKYPLEVSDYEIKGGLEGNFGSFTVNTALSWSKDFEKVKTDGVKYYTNGSMSAAVPKSGILLFSDSDYVAHYNRTYLEREKLIEDEIASEMALHTAAIFVRTPQTLLDLGFELPDTALKQIMVSYLMLDDVDGKVQMSGKLIMFDKSGARTMTSLLRNQLVQSIRRAGEKPNAKEIASLFSYEESIVTISNFTLPEGMAEKAKGIMNEAMRGMI